MLQRNPDPLARPFDDVLDGWLAKFDPERPALVNFRALVGCNSGVDRYTHLFHPYPAKLLLNIPLFFLNCARLRGAGRVFDPFSGSGTVLVEALAAGRSASGCDTNPLARLISSAKTTSVAPGRLREALVHVLGSLPGRGEAAPTGSLDLAYWFSPGTIHQLDRLASALRLLPSGPERTFLDLCFSVTVGKVSLTDPRIAVPVRLDPDRVRLTPTQSEERRRWLSARTDADVISLFRGVAEGNIRRMASWHDFVGAGRAARLGNDALRIDPGERYDLVITSPPYGSAQKYIRSSGIALQWLGLAPEGLRALERRTIGREHFPVSEVGDAPSCGVASAEDVLHAIGRRCRLRRHIAATFLLEMRTALEGIVQGLSAGGHLVLVVGNNVVKGHVFDTQRYLTDIAVGLGLTLELVLVDRIHSRGLLTRRRGSAGAIADERIILMRKA